MAEVEAAPFPVDDETLILIDQALDGTATGRTSMTELLELLSGYDPTKVVPLVDEDGYEVPDWTEYVGGFIYHEHDVIRSLMAEVRRLRGEAG